MRKSIHDIGIVSQDASGLWCPALLLPKPQQRLLGVVLRSEAWRSSDQLGLFYEISRHLLRDHPVVAFDRGFREVVGINANETTGATVSLAPHGSPADLDAASSQVSGKTLQPGGE